MPHQAFLKSTQADGGSAAGPIPWRLAAGLGVALAVIAFSVYAPSMNYGFVWDDPVVVESQVPALKTLGQVFFPPAGVPDLAEAYYRPLVLLSYIADDALAGSKTDPGVWPRAQARAFHRSSVVFHALATVMVFILGLALTRTFAAERHAAWTAAAAGLLFAVHPIHVDSTASVVGRSDVLCAIFGLSFLALYATHRRRGARTALFAAAGLALLSMLSKEPGVGLLALVPLIDALDQRRGATARPALRYGAFVGAAAIYGLLRWIALSRRPLLATEAPGRWGDLPSAFGWYLVKAVWPPLQTPFVPTIPAGFAWIGAAGAVALALAAWIFWKREWRRELMALALFLIPLVPALAVPVLGVVYLPVAERYLYLPSAGLCLLAAFLLQRGGARFGRGTGVAFARWLPAVVVLAISVPAAWATVVHQGIWRDNISLWTHAVRAAPRSGIARAQLGLALADVGRFDEAEAQDRHAVDLFTSADDRAKALNNLGSLRQRTGHLQLAREAFLAAIAASPDHWPARYNLALTDLAVAPTTNDPGLRDHFTEEALLQLEGALRTNPASVEAHLQLGLLLQGGGQPAAAREHFREVLRLAPASREAQTARRALGM